MAATISTESADDVPVMITSVNDVAIVSATILSTTENDVFLHNSSLSSFSLLPALKSLCAVGDVGYLNEIVEKLGHEMRTSLSAPESPTMLPSCISIPTGKEVGSFISVDLGGSTLRVAFIQLNGSNSTTPTEVKYRVSHLVNKQTKELDGKGFFLWIAHKLEITVKHAIEEKWIAQDYDAIPIGISWSFPFVQTSADRGYLGTMGKGYSVTDDIFGWDLKEAYEAAAREVGVRIKVSAIVNDTTAALITRAYETPKTRMSVILGTGVNAAAVIPLTLIDRNKLEKMELLSGSVNALVNTELSMFGTDILPQTCWDIELDNNNEIPGFQPLETKVSGRYLGEITRLILRDLVNAKVICSGQMPRGLDVLYGLDSATICDIETYYYLNRLDNARNAFLECHPCPSLTEKDMEIVCAVVIAVSSRSAAFIAGALVALADIMPKTKEECVIAYDGSVIEKYPRFRERCQSYLDVLGSSRDRKLTLKPAGDGSLVGPAIASSMHR